MNVQYVYNENGERESVIIPYKEWKRILPTIKKGEIDFDPDEYKGIYKNLDLKWDEEIKNLRDEWEREII